MTIVLEAFPVGHSVHVPASCFGRELTLDMKVRALVVSELVPLPICDSTIPCWHTHGMDRTIHQGNIQFRSEDFIWHLLCFAWEYKPTQWRCQWYQLSHPKKGQYLAHPFKSLRSRVRDDVLSLVVFELERM